MTSPFAGGPGPAAVYFAYRSAAWLAERTPPRLAERIAGYAARFAYRRAEGKRSVVERNQARVVGTGDHLEKVVKAAFDSYAQYWLETFRLGRYSSQDLLEMVVPVGDSLQVMQGAMAEGRGVLVVTPHLGFYDLGVAWVGVKGWPFTTVAEVLEPRALFEWFARIRSRHGLKVIPARNGKSVRARLAEVLDAGECVALVSDRDLGRRGIWVTFFGERTTFPASPPLLLVQKQPPLIGAAMLRRGTKFEILFERVPYALTGEPQADIIAAAQTIADELEKLVRLAPEQWHLFSTNWPSDEPHLPPRGSSPAPEPPAPGPPGPEPPAPEPPAPEPPAP